MTSQQTVTIGGVAWEAVFSADASYVRSRVSGAPRTLMIVVALFALSVLGIFQFIPAFARRYFAPDDQHPNP